MYGVYELLTLSCYTVISFTLIFLRCFMIFLRNFSLILCIAAVAACSKNGCRNNDPCACTDPASCAVSAENAACDFAKRAGDRVFFEFDKNTLSDASKETLIKQACWLKANPSIKVVIEGHCDERGTREYNMGLGFRRAQAVKEFLIEQGVTADRITVISYGKDRPVQLDNVCEKEEIHKANRVAISVVE